MYVPGQVQIWSKLSVTLRCHRDESLLTFQAIFENSRSSAVKHHSKLAKFWRWFKTVMTWTIENPLKAATHTHRGSGVRLTVSLHSPVGIF